MSQYIDLKHYPPFSCTFNTARGSQVQGCKISFSVAEAIDIQRLERKLLLQGIEGQQLQKHMHSVFQSGQTLTAPHPVERVSFKRTPPIPKYCSIKLQFHKGLLYMVLDQGEDVYPAHFYRPALRSRRRRRLRNRKHKKVMKHKHCKR